ncbi:hypothetical protein LJC00_03635, partial [Dysgonomonas sp. OttesenSCG-928-M03]|nr:hypothetical protein [Dysgonomonas sp. OttesenSCG-928-M03]
MSNKCKIASGKKAAGPSGYVYRDEDTTVEIYQGNRGIATNPYVGVMTFEVQGVSAREDILFSESKSIYQNYISDRLTLDLSGYIVPLWGEGH